MKEMISLDGKWKMREAGTAELIDAKVPGSVYSNLMEQGILEDPNFGENQYEAYPISEKDYEFIREFEVSESLLREKKQFLLFHGLDTIADIYLNDEKIGYANNMHRSWRLNVTGKLSRGKNILKVYFYSPIVYAQSMQEKDPLYGQSTTVDGYPHVRKAHYMYGWDWGPQLPDMGIFRSVELVGISTAQIDNVYIRQNHQEGKVCLTIQTELEKITEQVQKVSLRILDPQGKEIYAGDKESAEKLVLFDVIINNPQIWWPNGLGEHPLYEVEVCLWSTEGCIEKKKQKVGLRTLTISTKKDEWGREFCFVVNGEKIFAMGGDCIPEDQIIAHGSKEKTRKLLEACAQANFNHVRVWGGGYYPNDEFYDYCDELGLLVWQDFMFACSLYRMSKEFIENISQEIIENVKRLRNHACLAIWCGNNEMETAIMNWDDVPKDENSLKDYTYQYEELIPSLCKEYNPDTFYWPSSPSSGGGFDKPNDSNFGDVHYWDVWHGMKPLTEFRKFYFRFCSEYGFQSLPNAKTVRTFATPQDENLCSAVMEAHQKCVEGNKKLLYYLSQTVPYPYSFQGLIYASQLNQADAIRSNVEHMRRNRGRCMGSTYWQVNDSNPCISWSSIDYEGRWKALHYYAKRFYTPVLLSANEENIEEIVLNVSNEKLEDVKGTIKWKLRNAKAEILKEGQEKIKVARLNSKNCLTLDLSKEIHTLDLKRSCYLEYSLVGENDVVYSYGNSLFVQAKHFHFEQPEIQTKIREEESKFIISLQAISYAKSVCLDLKEADCWFFDNWFDIHGKEAVEITVDKTSLSVPMSKEELARQLMVFCTNDLLFAGNEVR